MNFQKTYNSMKKTRNLTISYRIQFRHLLWILIKLAINLLFLTITLSHAQNSSCDTVNITKYIGKASELSGLTNTICSRNLLQDLSDIYHKKGETDDLLKVSDKLIQFSRNKSDSVHLAKAFFSKGNAYREKFVVDSSFYYYDKSQKIFGNIGITKYRIKSIRRKAYLYSLISDYNKSLELNFKALKLAQQIDDFDVEYQSNFSIVITYGYLNEPNIAKKYHDDALKIINQHKDELEEFYQIYKSQLHNHLGSAYLKSDQFEEAKRYYLKAKNVSDIQKIYPELYAAIIGNIAYARFKSGEDEQVERQLKRSLYLKDSLNNQALTAVTKRHLAEYYHQQGNQAKSLSYIKAAYKTAEQYQLTDEILDALRLMAVIDQKNNEQHLNRYIKINDSIVDREREQRDKFARIEYETEQLQQANALKAAENDRLELQLLIAGLLTLFGFITIALIYTNVRRKSINKNLMLREENEAAKAELFKLILDQQKKIKQAKIKEQDRIAYELHDTIVSRLSAIRFKLFSEISRYFEKLTPGFEKDLKELSQLEADVRSISHDVKNQSTYLSDNFPLALKEVLQTLETSYGIKTNLHLNTNELYQIQDDHKIEIFKALQEGIQNIRKYAHANQVDLYINDTDDQVIFELHDNGVGFDQNNIKKGLGLKSIEKRIDKINAQFSIDTQIEEGTSIKIFYPI